MKRMMIASLVALAFTAHAYECPLESYSLKEAGEAIERFKANDAKTHYWDSPEQRQAILDSVTETFKIEERNCHIESDANDIIRSAEATQAKKPMPRIGWSKSKVLASRLGEPDHINRTVGNGYVHEQWVYSRYSVYLYFSNGVMTSFQQSE